MLAALASLFVVAQMMFTLPEQASPGEAGAADPAGVQVEHTPATATEPPQVTVNITPPGEQPQDLEDVFRETTAWKLFEGKRQVTLQEMMTVPFWFDAIKELVVAIIGFVPRVVVAFFLFGLFWLIYRAVRKVVLGSMRKANVDSSICDMLGSLIKWAILGFGLVIACNQIGVQIAALLTGVSIIGLAIGFAAQETLANFIAGIVIFWDKPFKVGDWIEIDGELGQVGRVTFRSTRLNNLDNDVVVFPNTAMLSQRVINKSANTITRASVAIGIAYKESIDHARQVLLSMFDGDPRVHREPEPILEVRACGASSVDLMVHFWIGEEKYEDAMIWEYTERAKKALDAAGIEIPFPHMQLLVEETNAIHMLSDRAAPQRKSA